MFKGTPELIEQRREEIVNACEQLYQTRGFKEITLKDIGNVTSFSRPTIYNYFQTREEIFLALYEREYDRWNEDLEAILGAKKMSVKELADVLAKSIEKRKQLLKLLSMNNYDMEANSREELLVSFKKAYGKSMENVQQILKKHCTGMDEGDIRKFIYIFFPFMFGIYPYTSVTDKQKDAMLSAKVAFEYQSVYEITYQCLISLLGES